MMANDWKSIVRRVGKTHVTERLMGDLVRLFVRVNPEIGPRITSERWAKGSDAVLPLAVSDQVDELLRSIPSETSMRERRFLYRFFRTLWNGKNDVLEIGPFLGGTTRAIALGMCHHPDAVSSAKLHTFDRFHGYYDEASLIGFLDPLIRAGVLDRFDLESVGDSGDFLPIFERIHGGHDYYQCIVPCNRTVPDKPEDLKTGQDYLCLAEGSLVSAVFVDGCKSWYGTKHFMREVAKAAVPGAHVIFQDYGWYTCFWISAFVELLRDSFELFAYVDTTYAFSLTKPLTCEAIEKRFPDRPSDLGEHKLAEVFDRLIEDAAFRNDYFAAVRHTLQKAGALAYVGNKRRAREIIAALKRKRWAAGHQSVIAAASVSPTYNPDGRVLLR